ncbi:MAG TPA: hypothetical protein VKU41_25260 [Polyangiaceae bacterium]|nr:hypothetical protein [Polyangiaceae bacterium]
MPTPLRSRLSDLASSFAASVLDAIRGASLEDLLAQSSGRGGRVAARVEADPAPAGARRRGRRLPRRSAGDIEQVIEGIVSLLKQHPHGLRAEQLRDKLGLQAKELPRPLKEGLDGGRLSKVGQKRATTYFAKGAGAGVAAAAGKRTSAGGRRGRRGRPAKSATRSPAAAKVGRGRRRGGGSKAATSRTAKKVPKARAARATAKRDAAQAPTPASAQA